MADLVTFSLWDSTGAPLTGVVPTFIDYANRSGVARTQPTFTELGGGLYGFQPTSADVETGTAYLVDGGVNAFPRYVGGAIHPERSPFAVVWFTDELGGLWSGAAATVGQYRTSAGASATAPGLSAVHSPYLYALTPTASDLAAGRAYRVDGAAGALPAYFSGTFSLPSTTFATSMRNPAVDLVDYLDGSDAGAITLEAGVNLFSGQVLPLTDEVSPVVFVLNTGGTAPEPLLGSSRAATYRPTVQVFVRGAAFEHASTEAIARDVHALLHLASVGGYLGLFAMQSQPEPLGDDNGSRPQWSMNFECRYNT